jgi:hypothetical protein
MDASQETVGFVDLIEKFAIAPLEYANELGSLRTLLAGIKRLTAVVKTEEARRTPPPGLSVFSFGATSGTDEEKEFNAFLACVFHWFGTSVCNYARLVGYIRGMTLGHFTRADLKNQANFKQVKKSINEYVDSIDELKSVRVWRNKVFAHFAITDPCKDDNIATLDMSVVFPVSFCDGRFVVGAMAMMRKDSSGRHTSELPQWSLTEVFEALEPRFWPGLKFVPPPTTEKQPTKIKP